MASEELQPLPQNKQEMSKTADEVGDRYERIGVSKSQIRKIYSGIKNIDIERQSKQQSISSGTDPDGNEENQAGDGDTDPDEKAKNDLAGLKPHLAFAASRDKSMRVVRKDIDHCIDKCIKDEMKLDEFFDLMEAIVAFHAYYVEVRSDN